MELAGVFWRSLCLGFDVDYAQDDGSSLSGDAGGPFLDDLCGSERSGAAAGSYPCTLRYFRSAERVGSTRIPLVSASCWFRALPADDSVGEHSIPQVQPAGSSDGIEPAVHPGANQVNCRLDQVRSTLPVCLSAVGNHSVCTQRCISDFAATDSSVCARRLLDGGLAVDDNDSR